MNQQSHFDIVITQLKPEHVEQVIPMFTRAFCNSEPMTHYIHMEYESFTPFATAVTQKAAKDQLSTVALSGQKVIACTLVEDITTPLALDFEITPKFGPIFNLLEGLSVDYFKKHNYAKNELAHLFITAVDEDHRGLGLSKKVNFAAMEIARKKHFKFMCSELTNYLNEKGLIKYLDHDKVLIGTSTYNNFVYESKKPFAGLEGSANAYIWSLDHNIKLTHKL